MKQVPHVFDVHAVAEHEGMGDARRDRATVRGHHSGAGRGNVGSQGEPLRCVT